MEEKKCFKCGHTKPIDEFYKHPQMADGHLNKCMECTKKDVRKRYEDCHDKIVAYEKKRARLPTRIAARREYRKNHPDVVAHAHREARLRNPHKYQAHSAVNNAIRDGRLVRQPCEVCGQPDTQAHHEDYSKPLDIHWLCRKHHLLRHGKVAYQDASVPSAVTLPTENLKLPTSYERTRSGAETRT